METCPTSFLARFAKCTPGRRRFRFPPRVWYNVQRNSHAGSGLGRIEVKSVAMRVPQPIPYQGSKRNIARYILGFFPDEFHTLIEPFAGSAAISIAAAATGKASKFWLNDINRPLMRLWDAIINNPEHVSSSYATL